MPDARVGLHMTFEASREARSIPLGRSHTHDPARRHGAPLCLRWSMSAPWPEKIRRRKRRRAQGARPARSGGSGMRPLLRLSASAPVRLPRNSFPHVLRPLVVFRVTQRQNRLHTLQRIADQL